MSKQRAFAKTIGGNMAESMGARPSGRHGGPRAVSSEAVADEQAGRSRMREAGYMLLENIIADPDQVRKEFSESGIQRLAASITKFGVLQPIRVRWSAEHGKHVILAGERRYRAATAAGLESIPCVFGDGELSESEKKQQQLTENCLREDLTPMEQARAFQELMELNSWNAQQLAEALCLSKGLVSQRLAVLTNLPEDLQDKVDDGTLSGAAAYQVSTLENPEEQREVVEQIEREKLNRDETAQVVKERKGTVKSKPGRPTTTKTFKLKKATVTIKFQKKRVTESDILAAVSELQSQLTNSSETKAA